MYKVMTLNRRNFLLFIVAVILLFSAIIIFITSDGINDLEGRGASNQRAVDFSFDNAEHVARIRNYIIVQRLDKLRSQEHLITETYYWPIHGGKYGFRNISRQHLNHAECISPIQIDDYKIQCKTESNIKVDICLNSLFSGKLKVNTIQQYIDNYEVVSNFFEAFPEKKDGRQTIVAGGFLPRFVSAFPNYKEQSINCWKDSQVIPIVEPNTFVCNESLYHRCKSGTN